MVIIHVCLRCGNEWAQRSAKIVPRTCPVCGSPYWMKPRRNGIITPKQEGERR